MYILGINAYHGDSSAALLEDGKIVCAFEEERFTRFKHWAGLPFISVRECLKDQNITIKDVAHIVISRNPKVNRRQKVLFALKNRIAFQALLQRSKSLSRVSKIREDLAAEFGLRLEEVPEVNYLEHHSTHMASTFFASPFEESAILSIDAFGDFCSTKTGIGRDNQIEVFDSVLFPHSIGMFYTAFTQYLNFNNYGDEYKVMGLAPYGEPAYLKKMERILLLKDNGLFELNLKCFLHQKIGVTTSILENNDPTPSRIFSDELIELFGPIRGKDEKLADHHMNIASSVQRMTELAIFHILKHLHAKTNCDNICIAGGVAQNSVANGKILKNTPFKKMYIPSASHDAGTSLGATLYFYNHVLKNERQAPIYDAYTGSKFTEEQIAQTLKDRDVAYEVYEGDELYDVACAALVDGGVLGWFQGRAEFGPRALGHRSILVDPRRKDAKELLNQKIKRRESFRPFAPSILKEHVGDYFEQVDDVPFMEKVFQIKEEKRSIIPAVTHVDGSGRLHSVDRGDRYYTLIERFYKATGVPVLLNTSFNENEPIVNNPEEALDCFLRTKMDMLVMGNHVVVRK
ncbi:MAG: carbamoyltransferase [Flavobacteriales bacterium]|nr:carbamoyltransferase [Flavobacteriales bacterium]